MLIDEFLVTYIIGAVGALMMVYLRWIGVMPRHKSSLEIDMLEAEYEAIGNKLEEKVKSGETITEAEEKYSNNLRDDIWRQKSTSFLGWAAMYVILGGAVAALFLGETIKDISQVDKVLKVASAGAFWTSFLSLLDTKVTGNAIQKLGVKADEKVEETIVKIREEAKAEIEKANSALARAKLPEKVSSEKIERMADNAIQQIKKKREYKL